MHTGEPFSVDIGACSGIFSFDAVIQVCQRRGGGDKGREQHTGFAAI